MIGLDPESLRYCAKLADKYFNLADKFGAASYHEKK